VDDQRLGDTPLETTEIPFGTSVIRVEKPGFVTSSRTVAVSEVNQLAKRRINVSLVSETALAVHKYGGWAGIGAGAIGVLTAGVMYLKASGYASDADQRYRDYQAATNTDDAVRLHREAADLDEQAAGAKTVSLAGLAVGGLLGGLGAYLLATTPSTEPVSVTADVVGTDTVTGVSLSVSVPW
jgi:hypothetical protein